MEIIEFEFEGERFEARADIDPYRVMRAMALASKDPLTFFETMSMLFNGKDVEYAEKLGDDKLPQLVSAAIESMGEDAKN